ncbi:hypothetical protein MKW92_039698 [Papaver armeniacum]|nr:hypothetical protein MKW92_039698 [Papaver armeniacum]
MDRESVNSSSKSGESFWFSLAREIAGPGTGAIYHLMSVHTFIRFLYSHRYSILGKKFVLHLLVLSHSYSVPPLKRICAHLLERSILTTENVIDASVSDMVQCTRYFTHVCSDGWKVMKSVDTALEQELLEAVVEAESKKEEKIEKYEEKKMYSRLNETMGHCFRICRDGCRTIGPLDKMFKGTQVFALVRPFSICKIRVPGGCVHCKRMPFKVKIKNQSKKDEAKWNLWVCKVLLLVSINISMKVFFFYSTCFFSWYYRN